MFDSPNTVAIAVVNTVGLFSVWAMVLGLSLGSFINVLAFRLPRGMSIVTRSSCRTCGSSIPFYYNVPLVSYLVLRGRGACCGTPIPPHYPLVEGFLAFLYFFIAYRYGLSYYTLTLFALSFFALSAAVADLDTALDTHFETGIIPDSIILFGVIFALGIPFASSGFAGVQGALFSGFVGFALLFVPATLYGKLRRKEMMGFGDYKLMGMLCLYLTPLASVFIILFASILGLIVGAALGIYHLAKHTQMQTPLPFAPMLAIAAVVFGLFPYKIYNLFLGISATLYG